VSEVSYDIITCTKCGQKLRVPANAIGKAYRCVRCGNIIKYQGPSSTEIFSSESTEKLSELRTEKASQQIPKEEIPTIGRWLVENNIITSAELEEALEIQKKEGGYVLRILYQSRKIAPQIFFDIVAKKTSAPKLDIKRLQPERELLELIPKRICYERFVFPMSRVGKRLTLAMACPEDTETQYLISQITGYTVQPVLSKLDDIDEAIEKYYSGVGSSLSQPKSIFQKIFMTLQHRLKKLLHRGLKQLLFHLLRPPLSRFLRNQSKEKKRMLKV